MDNFFAIKLTILLVLNMTSVSYALESDSTCEIVPHFSGKQFAQYLYPEKGDAELKGLSALWTQEYTGSDLLHEELITLNLEYPSNLIAILDNDWGHNNHATGVMNLMASELPTALLPPIELQFYQGNWLGDYGAVAERSEKSGIYPMYINNSMTWGDLEVPFFGWLNSLSVYSSFERLSKGNSLAVVCAGNKGMDKISEAQKISASEKLNLILVGSSNPYGFVSSFSQYAPTTAILAPGDYYQSSANHDGTLMKFGGTSGSTPEVTATLAAFTAITGVQLSRDEARALLSKTALIAPDSYYHLTTKNVGLLNSYKIGKVAIRLKDVCSRMDAPIDCIHKNIFNNAFYNFAKSETLASDLSKFSCGVIKRESDPTFSSCEKRDALKNIRANALLTGHPALFNELACIYRSLGYSVNASYFETLSFFSNPDNTSDYFTMLYQAKQRGSKYNDFVNSELALLKFKRETIPTLLTNITNTSTSIRLASTYVLGAIEPSDDQSIESLIRMASDGSSTIRGQTVASTLFLLKNPRFSKTVLNLNLEALNDLSTYVQTMVLYHLTSAIAKKEITIDYTIIEKVKRSLFQAAIKAVTNPDSTLQYFAIYHFKVIKQESVEDLAITIPILISALSDTSELVKNMAAETLIEIKKAKPSAQFLEQYLLTNPISDDLKKIIDGKN